MTPYLDILRSFISGPLTPNDEPLKIRDILANGNWEFSKISFDLPEHVNQTITTYPISLNNNENDSSVWSLTSNHLFSTENMYYSIRDHLLSIWQIIKTTTSLFGLPLVLVRSKLYFGFCTTTDFLPITTFID